MDSFNRFSHRSGWKLPGPPAVDFELNTKSPQATGLVGWCPTRPSFGSNILLDLSTVGSRGTLTGGLGWDVGTQGPVLAPDNTTTKYVTFPNSILNAAAPRPFTISWWYKANSNSIARHVIFTNNFNSSSPRFFCGIYQDSGTSYKLSLYSSSSVYSDTFVLDTDRYHHYAISWDTDDAVSFYRDGVSIGTTTKAQGGQDTDRAALFTLNGVTGNFNASGEMPEIRFYNRILLAAENWQLFDPATRWELYKPRIPTFFVVPSVAAAVGMPFPSRRHPSKNILLRM